MRQWLLSGFIGGGLLNEYSIYVVNIFMIEISTCLDIFISTRSCLPNLRVNGIDNFWIKQSLLKLGVHILSNTNEGCFGHCSLKLPD